MSIDLDLIGSTALITINRPHVLNAMDAEAYAQLSARWIEVRDNDAIRAVVITGAGERAFTAGADVKSYFNRTSELSDLWNTQDRPLLNRGLEVWKPVIAAVNGICLGGGVTLLLATDIRLATPDATFGLSEVKRGVIAANGGTQRLLDQLPYPIAMEMLLTGDAWDAARAERWGLINRIVAREDLIASALQIAAQIGANAPLAVQATKELAVRSRDLDLASGLRMEQLVLETLRKSEDGVEGVAAFRDRREPRYVGR